jgi:glycosyltransferase involved in cell wall biosynthesis
LTSEFRLTFIAPHQDTATAGGVFAIEQFAAHLASVMKVSLVVRQGETRPLDGVTVTRSETLSADTLPDADATILYINAPNSDGFFTLPPSKGERLLFLQGFRILGDEMIRSRLRLGLGVLCCSSWLAEEARSFGSPSWHVPYGLDFDTFFPGPPATERPNVVSMLCHRIDWKGTSDGLAALSLVKEARPETELRLFGVEPPGFTSTFLSHPSRPQVADLLRQSAVFVCPSWEEGFGMPGLEALACGAALATTDTKGSRDYAFHDQTALVSPPRAPALLAENISRLLDDVQLRERLCAGGLEYARAHYKPWPDAARVFGDAVLEGASHDPEGGS